MVRKVIQDSRIDLAMPFASSQSAPDTAQGQLLQQGFILHKSNSDH